MFPTVEARFSKVLLSEDSTCPSDIKDYSGNQIQYS